MKYLYRYLFWNLSNIDDYRRFPYQEVHRSASCFSFHKDEAKESLTKKALQLIEYRFRNRPMRCTLDDLLIATQTTSFIIIKNDTILYEKYLSGFSRDSVNTSFSIAKSFMSALTGIAIAEGYIGSIDDRVVDYIPEFKSRVSDSLSLKHLLSMSSGLTYDHHLFPWSDEPRSYYYPDLQRLIYKKTQQEYEPGTCFKYVNYNFILLGIILERAIHMPAHKFLQEKIWKPLEMEYPATWSTDSRKCNFTKMESGINARSIDFAKFGRLYLNAGVWNNRQLIPNEWITLSTSPNEDIPDQYYQLRNFHPYSVFFKDRQLYYKYGWWGIQKDSDQHDFMAIGIHGQFIYVSPCKKIIIVRNAKRWSDIDWWPDVFKQIEERL
jgi:CubicO group peptidase (beta-lactamase class C family)